MSDSEDDRFSPAEEEGEETFCTFSDEEEEVCAPCELAPARCFFKPRKNGKSQKYWYCRHPSGCDNMAMKCTVTGRAEVCIAHGAVHKRCKVEGCKNKSRKGNVCVKHGAVSKRCSVDGCEKKAIKGGVCIEHGAVAKRCTVEGCEKKAIKGGVCIEHGAVHKRCTVEGCEKQAKTDGVCIEHGAVHKRCTVEGCEKQAQTGGVCIEHGAVQKRCTAEGCKKKAQKDGVCMEHGAKDVGKCKPHGNFDCRICLAGKERMNFCSDCKFARLYRKRQRSAGGNGLCAGCETHKRAQAEDDADAEEILKSKSWEDLCLDELSVLVVDEQGRPVQCEMRDDMRHQLGSNAKRRRGECSTAHQRRPDLLYLKRDQDGHIVACIVVEIDEHSHEDREPECEAGKVDETFQALCQLAQNEGTSAWGGRAFAKMPYVHFLKLNPNACDASPPVPRKARIRVLAQKVMHLLATAEAPEGLSLPVVECLYYHSQKGKKHLDYFDARAAGAWDWKGNACPRL